MANKTIEKLAKIIAKPNLSEEDMDDLKNGLSYVFEQYRKFSNRTKSYKEIIENHKNKRSKLETLKELYDDEVDFMNARQSLDKSQLKNLQDRLLQNLTTNDLSEAELRHLKKTVEILKKRIAIQDRFNQGLAKGVAVSEQLLQTTLGISNEWGDVGIKGAIKGFGQGIKNNLTATNALATIVSFTFGQLMKLDETRSELFTTTGLQMTVGEISGITKDFADVFGQQAPQVTNQVLSSVLTNNRSSQIFFDAFESDSLQTIGFLTNVGVSSDASATLFGQMQSSLGMSRAKSTDFLKQIYKFNEDVLKVPPEMLFRETAEQIPFLSRYGRNFETVFLRLALNSKDTNLALGELISLGDSLDSIEMSGQVGGKLNALLGKNVFNVGKLLSLESDEKIIHIGEKLREYEQQHGKIGSYTMRTVAQTLQTEVSTVRKAMQGNVVGAIADLEGLPDPGEGNDDIVAGLKKELGQQQRLQNAAAKIGLVFADKIANNKFLVNTTNKIMNNLDIVLPLAIAGVFGLKAFRAATLAIGSPIYPANTVDMGMGMDGPDGRRSSRGGGGGTQGKPGSGARFSEKPARFGTGRNQMYVGPPPGTAPPPGAVPGPPAPTAKPGFFSRMATSAKNVVSRSGPLKTAVRIIKGAGGTLLRGLTSIPGIGAIIESIFTVGDIRSMIASGITGSQLYRTVGARVFEAIGGVIGGAGAAALVQALNILPGLGVLAAPLAYILGDMLGRFLARTLAETLSPSTVGSFGKFILDMFYDENEIAGSPVGTTASGRKKFATTGITKQFVQLNNDRLRKKTFQPVESGTDPILAGLSDLLDMIDELDAKSNQAVLQVGLTRVGMTTS